MAIAILFYCLVVLFKINFFSCRASLRCGDEIAELEGVSIYYNDGFFFV